MIVAGGIFGILTNGQPDTPSAQADATERTPSFNLTSVPAELRPLEGKAARIRIPGPEAPLLSARGALLHGSVQAQVVTDADTASIPMPLAQLEQQMDRRALGAITDDELVSYMRSLAQRAAFVLLKDGTEVRVIAPRVNGGFATQVVALTGAMSTDQLNGREVHLWVASCFLTFNDKADQALLERQHSSCER